MTGPASDLDFDNLFWHLPMAIIVARHRVMVACNQRALEVFKATRLLDGLTSKQIARQLGISPRTVDVHRGTLIRKHGVSTKSELVKRLAQ